MGKSAVISPCGQFRYELRRVWDDKLPPFVAGMLNPSIADAEIDDPTINRAMHRAKANGCGSLIVWNLGAGRATNPKNWMAMRDPIGPENDTYIWSVLTECRERFGIAFVGWGAHGSFMNRDEDALRIAVQVGIQFCCLGMTRDGQPRHPLYVAARQQLVAFAGCVHSRQNPESSESLVDKGQNPESSESLTSS
jgi:hypothetical protein